MTERTDHTGRWAWAEIDLDAVRHNVGQIRQVVSPSDVWAVVKADGYGHGAVPVALAALEGGATGLCVALVTEGVELRRAGIGVPILVLSEQPDEQLDDLVAHDLIATAYSVDFVAGLAARARAAGRVTETHVKVDTGMQRVGVQPEAGVRVAQAIDAAETLTLAGVYSHLACADEPDSPANDEQSERFERAVDDLRVAGVCPDVVHLANSASALSLPPARRSFVRLGIAMYGISPGPGVDDLCEAFRPVLSLRARISHVKRVAAGSSISYGWRHRFDRDTTVATVPAGYADGVPRRLGTLPDREGACVLIGGRRCPIVGVVTMDQFMVDLGDEPAHIGDEVVLIGEQGDDRIHAEEWAARLGTIGYEIVCGISARIPRLYSGTPTAP